MKTNLAIACGALLLSFSQHASAQERPLTARVHIDGSTRAVLEGYDGDEWRPLCKAPCDRSVLLTPAYRIAGPDVQPSRPFAISTESEAHLTVDTRSQSLHILGVVLVPLGGVSLGTGLMLMVIGSVKYACGDCIDGLADTTMVNWGWGLAAAGLVGLITGVTLIQSTRTKVNLWGDPTPYVRLSDVATRENHAPKSMGWPVFAVSF